MIFGDTATLGQVHEPELKPELLVFRIRANSQFLTFRSSHVLSTDSPVVTRSYDFVGFNITRKPNPVPQYLTSLMENLEGDYKIISLIL
jgi:hypothetical protein